MTGGCPEFHRLRTPIGFEPSAGVEGPVDVAKWTAWQKAWLHRRDCPACQAIDDLLDRKVADERREDCDRFC